MEKQKLKLDVGKDTKGKYVIGITLNPNRVKHTGKLVGV